jgi:hypothetical protein
MASSETQKGAVLIVDDRCSMKAPRSNDGLHPAWAAFLKYCGELQHGEIERLKIQDGLPVLAEVTKKKVKFGP